MAKYFTLLIKRNTKLARAEIESLLRLIDDSVKVVWNGILGIIDSDRNPTRLVLERSASLREAGEIIGILDSSLDSIDEMDNDIQDFIGTENSFCVRTVSLEEDRLVSFRSELTRTLGAFIEARTGARVSLNRPDVRVLAVLSSGSIFLCKSYVSRVRGRLQKRSPGSRPFFHPSMMNSELARIMCNLAGVVPGNFILDPFCGGGGILQEIALLGGRAIGVDLSWKFLSGASQNLSRIHDSSHCLIQGDVRQIPIGSCDCIVTDPPYGRVSSTRGECGTNLVRTLFDFAPDIIQRGGRLSVCGTSEMNISNIAEDAGIKHRQCFQIPVHSGLVREVLIAQF